MAEPRALVVQETGEIVPFDRGPISIDEAKKRIKENQENAIAILEENIDWKKFPGLPPMLLKPAAEKLSRYAGVVGLPPVQAHYEIIEREADPFREWDFEKKVYDKGKSVGMQTVRTRGFYRYRVRCTLCVLGTEIAVGNKIGVCSSVDPGKETAMENTILQQAQIRANRQAVMAYIGISDRFTEEEAGDEIKRRKEAVGDTKGQPKGETTTPSGEIPKPQRSMKSKYGSEKKPGKCNFCGERHVLEDDPIVQHPGTGEEDDELEDKWGHADCYAATFGEAEPDPHPDDKTKPEPGDPTRESLLKEIPKLEAELGDLNDAFRPMKAREKSFGGTDITKSKDQDLIDYWTSLKSAIDDLK